MYADIYWDEAASTVACATKQVFYGIKGATSGLNAGNRHIRPEPENSTASSIVIGSAGEGNYLISMSASFTSDTNNCVYHVAVHVNGTKQNNISIERKIGTAGDLGAAASQGICRLSNGDKVDIRVACESTGGVVATFNHGNLSAVRIN